MSSNKLAHTVWDCKYHLVFVPKYRRKIIMCISIPPKYSVSSIVGYLKGKRAIMIFERFNKLRQNFKGHSFWARGYYISTVGLDEQIIRNYIKNQKTKEIAEERYENKKISNPF